MSKAHDTEYVEVNCEIIATKSHINEPIMYGLLLIDFFILITIGTRKYNPTSININQQLLRLPLNNSNTGFNKSLPPIIAFISAIRNDKI